MYFHEKCLKTIIENQYLEGQWNLFCHIQIGDTALMNDEWMAYLCSWFTANPKACILVFLQEVS